MGHVVSLRLLIPVDHCWLCMDCLHVHMHAHHEMAHGARIGGCTYIS